MQWRALKIDTREVRVAATGETFQTLATFQGHDGESDIVRAHLVADGDDICLLTEYEDAAGKRALGRTTQWPREVFYHCMNSPTAALFDAVDTETPAESEGQGGSGQSAAPVQPAAPATTDTPQQGATGGSGDPAAPAGENPLDAMGEPLAETHAEALERSIALQDAQDDGTPPA